MKPPKRAKILVKLTERHAGIHVAVRVDGRGCFQDDGQAIAVSTLPEHGAWDIEQAEGAAGRGKTGKDFFDPREVVHLFNKLAAHQCGRLYGEAVVHCFSCSRRIPRRR